MRVVIAPDKFAGTLSAAEAADAMADGWLRARPDDDVDVVPMADGGAGTVAVLADALEIEPRTSSVADPRGRRVKAQWLLLDGGVAIIESAAACGLHLLDEGDRDPRVTTTYGVGELVAAAIDAQATQIAVGVGGSATNDGGAGFATALGARLFDMTGTSLPRGGAELARLARVDLTALEARLRTVPILAATDADHVLCGQGGTSAVYGPQKGADGKTVAELDSALAHYASILARDLPATAGYAEAPGAGAGGGLGFGLLAFAGARIVSGVDLVASLVGLDDAIAEADVVLTGEGRFDATSLRGKAVAGVARRARAAGKPCGVLAGEADRTVDVSEIGRVFALRDVAPSKEAAFRDAAPWLTFLAERVATSVR